MLYIPLELLKEDRFVSVKRVLAGRKEEKDCVYHRETLRKSFSSDERLPKVS